MANELWYNQGVFFRYDFPGLFITTSNTLGYFINWTVKATTATPTSLVSQEESLRTLKLVHQSAACICIIPRTPNAHHISLLQQLPITHCSRYKILRSTTSHLCTCWLNSSTLPHLHTQIVFLRPPLSVHWAFFTTTGEQSFQPLCNSLPSHLPCTSSHLLSDQVQTQNTPFQT